MARTPTDSILYDGLSDRTTRLTFLGTFPTSHDVRPEPGMRTKADVRRPLRIYGFTPQASSHHPDVASLIQATVSLRLLHRPVTHCLDFVAVGIAQEGAVVGGMIVAQAGWPVVGAAGGDAGVPERVDVAARFGLEAPMPAGGFIRPRALVDGDVDAIRMVGVSAFAVAEPAVAAADLDDFERLHDRVVEVLGRG
jgi:hypothetical protein